MKKIMVLLLLLHVCAYAVVINDKDIRHGYARVMEYSFIENTEEAQKIFDLFVHQKDQLKKNVELWCLSCKDAAAFETCLIKNKKEYLGSDLVMQKCATNIVLAKVHNVLKLFTRSYTITEQGYDQLMKAALLEIETISV